jgi:hypothetical protein
VFLQHKTLSILEASIITIDVHEAEFASLLSENVQRAACRILPWCLSNLAFLLALYSFRLSPTEAQVQAQV